MMTYKQTKATVGAQRTVGVLLVTLFLAAPNAALAQNDCGGDPAVDVGDDTYDCADASYDDGVTYDADGNLTVNFTNGGTTTIGGSVDGNGIDLDATGGDGITVDSDASGTALQNQSDLTGALLEATTVDGNINIDVGAMDASAAGVTHAIYAESSGSGGINIGTTDDIDAQGSNPAGSIGIEAITADGGIDLTIMGDVAGYQSGIAADSGGDLTIDIVSGAINADAGGVAMDLSAAGTTVVENAGSIGSATSSASINEVAIRAAGGDFTLENDGDLEGRVDFTGLSGTATININAGGQWSTRGVSDFGPGTGEVNNAGTFELSSSNANNPSLVTLNGLETFNNAGVIGFKDFGNDDVLTSDVLSIPGATFNGLSGSVLRMDATLEGGGQSGCGANTIADCLSLAGGTTTGETGILLSLGDDATTPFVGEIGPKLSPGVVLVEVEGGSTQAGHFVLDPGSEDYAEDPIYGGVIDTGGLFDYALLYDGKQRHMLASVPQPEAVEYVAFIQEALSVWHTTADGVAGRQADLRRDAERGGWVRFIGESTERDAAPTLTTHGNTFTYEQSYSQFTGAIIAGNDMWSGDNYVGGLHLGFIASSRLKHDETGTTDKMTAPTSVTVGGYGSWWYDNGLSLDGTVNANLLTLEHSVDGHEGSESAIKSLGIRAEAAWRFPLLDDVSYVQPLVTAAYVRAGIEQLSLRDYDASFKGEESQRAALGLRLGGDTAMQNGGRLGYWLTARAWEEYADEGRVEFQVEGGEPLAIRDDLSGSFEEVGLGVEVANEDGGLSGYLSAGAKFADETDSYNVSIGGRLRW